LPLFLPWAKQLTAFPFAEQRKIPRRNNRFKGLIFEKLAFFSHTCFGINISFVAPNVHCLLFCLTGNAIVSDASTGRRRRPGLPWLLGPGIPLPADTASAQPSLPKNERPHKSQQRAGAGCIAAMGRNFSLSHDTGLLTACTDACRMAGGAGRMSP
jgi:hypothetical protein